jgi:SAM-dependent methyltransferase
VQGSALALPYPADHFQAVTCIEVLEHLSDDGAALREIRRVLEPGGLLALTVPYRHWFPAYRTLIGHERHYDRRSLEDLLGRHGFHVEKHIPNFPRWHRAADYSYVFCRLMGLIASRVGAEGAPQRVRLPGTNRPLLRVLNDAIEPLYVADSKLDYARLPAATSMLARRSV